MPILATPHRAARRAGTQTRRPAQFPVHPPRALFEPDSPGVTSTREWHGTEGLEAFTKLSPVLPHGPFWFQSRAAAFGPFHLSYFRHSPLSVSTPADNFGHASPTLRVLVVFDGAVAVRLHCPSSARTVSVKPRQGVLLAGWMPRHYAAQGPVSAIVIDVPADHPVVEGAFDEYPVAVRVPDTLASASAMFAADLLKVDTESMSAHIRAQSAAAIETLVAGIVSASVPMKRFQSASAYQRREVLQYIAKRCADKELNAEMIATRFGISKRSVQRLFERDTMTLTQHITAQRVEQVLSRLRDPRYANVSLDEIAQLTGFGTGLALRRAISRVAGITPSRYREVALSTTTSDAQQPTLAGMEAR